MAVPGEAGAGAPIIPGIAGLTGQIREALSNRQDIAQVAERAWDRCVGRNIPVPTVEDVLGHIRTLQSLCGNGTVDGFSRDELVNLDSAICAEIRTQVSKALPSDDTPFHVLAGWIRSISREKPVEIFTTNYDLLIEQALEECGVPYFDGFIGSDSAFLDLESMAEDDLPARWTRLWKIHGSINWWLTNKSRIRRSREPGEGEQLLIYPSHLKYDQSREMPYFAMIDRLRVFLRSDQCVLLTCGYSYGDDHINSCIRQGLAGNPNASCLAMIFGSRADVPKGVRLASTHGNFSLLASDGGIIGTASRAWSQEESGAHPAYPIAVKDGKWCLGNFSALGQFLQLQLSRRDVEREGAETLR